MRRVFIKTNPGPLKQCECFPNQIVRNEYSLTEAARGFIANTRKYISAPMNHLLSFYSLLKLVRRAVNGKWTQLPSSVNHSVVSKVSSLDLSERGRRKIGDGGKARGRGGKRDERERTWESGRARGGW